jgi:hydrocephalus-inducing protein
VSLGFPKQKEIELINESEVSIKYRLRISTDSKDINTINTIFLISPIQGIIEKREKKKIELEFKPESERAYEIVVLMDMEDIGYDMLTLPITAVCEIPEVIIDPSDELNFEKVYIRAETIKTIKLINTSNSLNAQFQILPQDETSKTWGILTCQTDSGKIGPEETYYLNVCLVPNKLGPFRLKLEILCKTKNNMGNTTNVNIKAHSIGPTIKLEKSLEELDFGSIHVLNTRKDKISLVNDNPIDATYTAFMKNVPNIYSIVNKSGIIPKKSMIDLEILCRPDEAMRFAELLYIKIDEADDIKITLKCRGEGTTVVIPDIPDTSNSIINFGTVFTSKPYEREIRFENRGRSKQNLVWVKKNIKKPNQRNEPNPRQTQNPGPNKNKNANVEDEEKKEIFTLAKKSGFCQPRTGCHFKLIAFSQMTGQLTETFQIQNFKDGESSGGSPTWDNVQVTAEFIDPSLEYQKKIFFTFSYDKEVNIEFIKNNLTIKNVAKLEAQFMVSVIPPFTISKDKFVIAPNEVDTFEITFDPSSYKIKKEISNFVSKMQIQHTNHDKLETIDLVGKINFPNLTITPTKLDFGCLLNDTFKKNLITLENESEMDVIYEWFLVEEENSYEPTKAKRREGRKIPLNEVFGIIPMNGRLKKGEKEVTEISFSPGMNQKYIAKAKCCVEGGPEYLIDLVGEASEIKYKIVINDQETHDMNKREFNILFGEIPFNERSKLEMVIKNEGDVPFVYRINYMSDRLRYMSISSIYEEIRAKEFKKIEIEIIPGVPDTLDDEMVIEIAHFEPIKVRVKGIGIYRGLVLSAKRNEQEFKDYMMEAETRLESRKKKMTEYIPNYLIKKSVNLIKKAGTQIVDKKSNLVQTSATLSLASEHEMEVNRDNLCQKLIEKMNKFELVQQTGNNRTNLNPNTATGKENQLGKKI